MFCETGVAVNAPIDPARSPEPPAGTCPEQPADSGDRSTLTMKTAGPIATRRQEQTSYSPEGSIVYRCNPALAFGLRTAVGGVAKRKPHHQFPL